MKLFFSYARVDSPTANKLIELMQIHQIWYDKRLFSGDNWWKQIVEAVERAEGFIYLISPDSLKSEYCNKEFLLAASQNKHVFPVLIQPIDDLPEPLCDLPTIDMSDGVNAVNITQLHNAIILAERSGSSRVYIPVPEAETEPEFNPDTFMKEATEAIRSEEFDRAVYLLRMAVERKLDDPTGLVKMMLQHAEEKLAKQAYLRAAARDYEAIGAFLKRADTRNLGIEAFVKFRQQYPDYDPDNIGELVATELLPNLAWCDVPAGEVTLTHDKKRVTYHVNNFKLSQYPITNAQFQMFVDAEDGYCDSNWWDFSHDACVWRKYNKQPLPSGDGFEEHPRVNVSWYEAMAFCRWLSHKVGKKISLPTESQWKRAAQGDDNRLYPWGARFDETLCNTRESKLKQTTDVRRYAKGASPYGVMDMAGNVWEWCRNTEYGTTENYLDLSGKQSRVARGGSYSSQRLMVRNTHHMVFAPESQWNTVGFRVVAL